MVSIGEAHPNIIIPQKTHNQKSHWWRGYSGI